MARRFTLIGPGRAGLSLRAALIERDWECVATYGRDDDVSAAATDVELCVLATPDGAIESVANAIDLSHGVLLHLSGVTPLAALGNRPAATLHPLASLANAERGAAALTECHFAVAGDPLAQELAEALSGKWFRIDDADRSLYHGAAAVAANHLVALLGQVERMAAELDIPFEAFFGLVQTSVDNSEALGPAAALTGPVARGDEQTIESHRRAIAERLPEELAAYDAMVELARRLLPR